MQNTHSSQVHTKISQMIDHMLGHKISLNKFKKIEIISSIFSSHHGMKLEINYKEKAGKYMETKQHAIEQLLGQRRSQRRNQKLPENK